MQTFSPAMKIQEEQIKEVFKEDFNLNGFKIRLKRKGRFIKLYYKNEQDKYSGRMRLEFVFENSKHVGNRTYVRITTLRRNKDDFVDVTKLISLADYIRKRIPCTTF